MDLAEILMERSALSVQLKSVLGELQDEARGILERVHSDEDRLDRSVLVVDDDQIYADSLRAFLSNTLQVPAYTAYSYNEALRVWRQRRSAVVVTDFWLNAGQHGDKLLEEMGRGARGIILSGVLDTVTLRVAATKTNAIPFEKNQPKLTDELPRVIRRLLNKAAPPLYAVTAKNRWRYVSMAFLDLLGYAYDEIVGHAWLEFVHPDDTQPSERVALQNSETGEGVRHFSNRLRTKSGAYRRFNWSISPPVNGEFHAFAELEEGD